MTSKSSPRVPAPAALGGFLCLALALLAPGRAAPAAAEPLPPWLVPVVRVVSGDRVVPTTGVSLGQGRVLVPGDFAAHDQPLYALDGGADLRRHGRPASVSRRLRLAGLAVLDVPGLQRPVPDLAEAAPGDGEVVALLAYPPPELIQAGQGSVRALAGVRQEPDGAITVAPERPLPNLTGVLVNACGQWLGYSAARGLASMATGRPTLYRWLPELKADLVALDVNLASSACSRDLSFPLPPTAEPREDAETAPVSPKPSPPASTDTEAETVEDPQDLPPPPVEEPLPVEEAPTTGTPPQPEEPPRTVEPEPDGSPVEPPASGEPGVASGDEAAANGHPAWAWVLVALTVVIGAAAALAWRRRRQRIAGAEIGVEPAATPWLRLEGAGAGAHITLQEGRVDAVLGRFDADVLLAGKSISRRHARLHGTPDGLLLTDLDSTNGSWINGQRCPPGEAVPVQVGDELRFGELACRLAPWRSTSP